MNLSKKVDELKEELISSTQEILKVKSVQEPALPGKPYGASVDNALNTALAISKRLGFKTTNLDGYIGYAEYGEGEDYVAVLGHLDVVPEGEGWKYPPYAAEIHDGKIYARGSLDDKGPIMACLYGLKAISELNLKLSKRVRIIFGTNEETGSGEMHYYNSHEKAPVSGFTPDAEYPMIFGEKGITIFNLVKELNTKPSNGINIKYIKGGLAANMVPDHAEALVESKDAAIIAKNLEAFSKETNFDLKAHVNGNTVVINSVGIASHGSFPERGKNAIMQLLAFLGTLDLGKCDIKDAIDFLNENIGFDTCGVKFGIALEDKPSGKLCFNTGVIDMSEDKINLTLNIRYPVTLKYDDMMNPFNKRIEGTGFKVENMMHQEPLFFPEDHPLIKTLQEVYTRETGLDATPKAIGGGTYAKEMSNIVAFGPIFPGKPDLDHQVDENIEVEDLIANAKIYANAIYELAK
jgi:succinyl-diaminopimelate desuccinylase